MRTLDTLLSMVAIGVSRFGATVTVAMLADAKERAAIGELRVPTATAASKGSVTADAQQYCTRHARESEPNSATMFRRVAAIVGQLRGRGERLVRATGCATRSFGRDGDVMTDLVGSRGRLRSPFG